MTYYHWLGRRAADAAREQAELDQRAVDMAEMARFHGLVEDSTEVDE